MEFIMLAAAIIVGTFFGGVMLLFVAINIMTSEKYVKKVARMTEQMTKELELSQEKNWL